MVAGAATFNDGCKGPAKPTNTMRYKTVERWNYLKESQKTVEATSFISVCVDGVSVGKDTLLNMVLWAPEKGKALICPPQARGC